MNHQFKWIVILLGLLVLVSTVSAAACSPNTVTVGSNKVLFFNTTGTCDWTVPTNVTNLSYLLIAGGGGGAFGYGGGGGAGGVWNNSTYVIAGTIFNMTIGTGGIAGVSGAAPGNGTNTSFTNSSWTTTIAIGGGRGAGVVAADVGAGNGGSGGGRAAGDAYGSPGSGTAGQGNNGGPGYQYEQIGAGGGGGAGAVGGTGTGSVGGKGGNGTAYSITGTSIVYGGGGGGGIGNGGTAGAGGSGGGGAGSNSASAATNGLDVYGGGGGGGAGSGTSGTGISNGGKGGNGSIILSYPDEFFNDTWYASGSCFYMINQSSNDTIVKCNTTGTYNWTLPSNITNFKFLVIAGGGGGGGSVATGDGASGGGAGGYIENTTGYSVVSGGIYNITVGSGGAGGVARSTHAGNGTNSSFGNLTLNFTAVGGGHGDWYGQTSGNGGSGGGGAATGTRGTGISGQGYNGGYGVGSAGGGGGGAGSVGYNATDHTTTATGGAGGNGTNSSITGVSTCYAGGGSSGSYKETGVAATCGGGSGGASSGGANGLPGTNETGGGGGGATLAASGDYNGGLGGTGIVYLRYNATVTATQPVANFTMSNTTGWNSLKVNFTDTSTNTPTSWNWTFGGANFSDGQHPNYTFVGAGNYTVILNVSNSAGWNNTTRYVTVFGPGSYGNNTTLFVNSSVNLTYYTVRLIVNNTTGVSNTTGTFYVNGTTRTDWSDIVFTDTSNNLLDFWMENHTQSVNDSSFWIELPNIWSLNNTTIKMYYGCSTHSTTFSNGSNTFPLFDDFDNASVQTVLWNTTSSFTQSGSMLTVPNAGVLESKKSFGTNTAYRARVNIPAGNAYSATGYQNLTGSSYGVIFYTNYVTANVWNIINRNPYPTETSTSLGTTYTGNRTYDIYRNGSGSTMFKINDTYVGNTTTNVPTGGLNVSLFGQAQAIYSDWVLVRNFTLNEPIIISANGTPPLPPVANFTMSNTTGWNSVKVNFTDTSTNSPTSWNWTFGGANFSDGQNPNYTFVGAGNYTVRLNASNSGGWSNKTLYVFVGKASDYGNNTTFFVNSSFNATNYQIKLVLNNTTNVSNSVGTFYTNGTTLPNWFDVVFVDSSDNLLGYWRENHTDVATNTTFWIKVPNVWTLNNTTIKMYYGCSTQISSFENGYKTFEFFDDFLGGSLNTSQWLPVYGTGNMTYNTSYGSINITNVQLINSLIPFNITSNISRSRHQSSTSGIDYSMPFYLQEDSTYQAGFTYKTNIASLMTIRQGVGLVAPAIGNVQNNTNYYISDIYKTGSTYNLTARDSSGNVGSTTSATYTSSNPIANLSHQATGGTVTLTIDFDFVRKYISPEPVIISANGSAPVVFVNDTWYANGSCFYMINQSTNDTIVKCNTTGTYNWTVPANVTNFQYLVIAGGGGGGGGISGGGGAGGFRNGTLVPPVAGIIYNVTVGAGGAGSATNGANGSNSSFGNLSYNITSAGGGRGTYINTNAGDGGSGGASRNYAPGNGNTPSVTPSQGNGGGAGCAINAGAGGGGAGANGSTCGAESGGNGGSGRNSSITGYDVTYAGGGGGSGYVSESHAAGSGGSGGGGTGGTSNTPPASNGTDELGGGGGGGGYCGTGGCAGLSGSGGNGGSGVVYLRYNTSSTLPVANFTMSNISVWNSSLKINFTDTSTGIPTSYNWTFGGANFSDGQNPNYTFVGIGNYTVILNVSNAAGWSNKTAFALVDGPARYGNNTTFFVNSSTNLTGYQVKIILNNTTGVSSTSGIFYTNGTTRTDWKDIVFTDSSDNLLGFWRENNTEVSTNTTFWIRVPAIWSLNNTTIRMYYGCSTQPVSFADGYNTFQFFDDFINADLSLNWTNLTSGQATISNGVFNVTANSATARQIYSNYSRFTWTQPYAVRSRVMTAHWNDSVHQELIFFANSSTSYGQFIYYSLYTAAYTGRYNNYNGGYNTAPITGWSAGTYHIQDVMRNGTTSSRFRVDNANDVELSTGYQSTMSGVGIYADTSGSITDADWVFVRNYTQFEPIIISANGSAPIPFTNDTWFASGSCFYMINQSTNDTIVKCNTTGTYNWTIPANVTNFQYLVVAGGGGGGSNAGGGGAGGLLTGTGYSIKPGAVYNITVGTGGAGGSSGANGTNGSNSSFGNLSANFTSVGGGGGGGNSANGFPGGSGGGAGGTSTGKTGGSNVSGQGFAGGSSNITSSPYPSAGGGGAGSIGFNTSASTGGNGGSGYQSSITGSALYYAGGGAGGSQAGGTGGTGGSGVGGDGTVGTNANNGVAETGSGGGGAGWAASVFYTGGSGSSGVVILRYNTSLLAPVANFTMSNTTGWNSLKVNFTDTSTNSPTSWNWTFGGANFSDGQNPNYTFVGAGNYTVILNASNSAGWNNTTRYVVVYSPLVFGNNTTFFVNSTQNLTNYQVKVILNNTTGISNVTGIFYTNGTTRVDWSDIVFTDTSDNLLGFWKENNTNVNTNATFWIKVPYIYSLNNTTIKMYYGCSTASSTLINGYGTFLFFDDFLDPALNSNWTNTVNASVSGGILNLNNQSNMNTTTFYTTNTSIRGRVNFVSGSNTQLFGFFRQNPLDTGVAWDFGSAQLRPANFNGGSSSFGSDVAAIRGAYHIFEVSRNSTISAVYSYDNSNFQYLGTNLDTGNREVDFYAGMNTPVTIDWVFVRAYNLSSSEPIIISANGTAASTPIANFTMSNTTGWNSLKVNFTDTSTNTPTSWNWTFGGANFSDGQNPNYTFVGAGNYTVILNASNSAGWNNTTRYVFVDGPVFYTNNVTITITNPVNISNYQHNITLAYRTNMTANFSDIRFSQTDGTKCSYWVYNKTDSSSAIVWIKVPSALQTQLFMYYGNNSAVNESDGLNTFDLFDDFLGTSINTSKWIMTNTSGTMTVSGGSLTLSGNLGASKGLESVTKFGPNTSIDMNMTGTATSSGGRFQYGYGWYADPGTFGAILDASDGDNKLYGYARAGANSSTLQNLLTTSTISFITREIKNWGFSYNYNSPSTQYFTNTTDMNVTIGMWGASNSLTYSVEQIRVRKYNATEPVLTAPTAPVASFTMSNSTGWNSVKVNFTDTSTNTPTSWNWTFGGANFSDGQNPNYTFVGAGNYSVTLIASNSAGSNTTIQYVFVSQAANYGNVTTFFINSTQNLTNYQVKIILNNTTGISNMSGVFYTNGTTKVDWADIVFVDNSDGLLGFWRENRTNVDTNATFWIKVPYIYSVNNTTIKMYYGCSTVVSLGSGDNTFAFFDDFGDTTLSVTKWIQFSSPTTTLVNSELNITLKGAGASDNYSAIWQNTTNYATFGVNYSAMAYRKSQSVGSPLAWGFNKSLNTPKMSVNVIKYSGNNISGMVVDTGSPTYSTQLIDNTNYHKDELIRNTTTSGILVRDSASYPMTTNVPSGSFNITIGGYTGGDFHYATFDWIAVRKFNVTEPIIISANGTAAVVPIANFTMSNTSGESPLKVNFTDTSTNSPTSWNWTFGGANFSDGQNPNYTFVGVGNYTVILNVSNSAGWNNTTKYVNVTPFVNDTWHIAGSCFYMINQSTNDTIYKCNNTSATMNWTTPANITKVQYLVVAGGGGGGGNNGQGGGGAGGMLNNSTSLYTVYPGFDYTIVVGDGGAQYTRGQNSSFGNLSENYTAIGGGFGGGGSGQAATSGGSGGGGGGIAPYLSGGAGTSGQGNAGGNGGTFGSGTRYMGGGGGGAGAVGQTAADMTNGAGGDGRTSMITGCLTYYAGGGGGYGNAGSSNAAGGAGGGGAGNSNGVDEYGGGGGASATGGSGVVYLRYNPIIAPVANFVMSNSTGLTPLLVNFTDTSVNTPTAWNWTFGGANFSDAQYPNYTFVGAGNYTVILNASNSGGWSNKTLYVEVFNQVYANFTSNVTSGLYPLNVQFNDTSNNTPISWNWSFGDGTWQNGTTQNVTYVYSSGGKYTVTLIAANAGGPDTEIKVDYITVYNQTIANISSNVTSGLTYAPVQFNASNSTNATWWNWSFGDGTVDNITNMSPMHIYASSGNYTVNLTTSNDGWGENTQTNYYIQIYDSATTGFIANTTVGVYALSVGFNVTNGNDNATQWNWSFGDGTWQNGTTQNATHVYSTGGIYTVSETASNPHSTNTTTVIDYITVYNQTIANISSNVTSGLTYAPVQFNASNSTNATWWNWSFGDGTVDNITNESPLHVYTASGNYTVNLTTSNDGWGENTQTNYYIQIYDSATTGFISNTTVGIYPLNVGFNVTSGDNATQWNWSFGDGTWQNGTTQNATHVYSTGGIYTVSETASNPHSTNTTTMIDYIRVYNQTIANISSNVTSGLTYAPVQFNASNSTNATWWNWSFGDGSVDNITNESPLHIYTASGNYTVNLTTSNDGWGENTQTNYYIQIYDSATTGFVANTTIGVYPLNVGFNVTSGDNATQWNWSFGDGTWQNGTTQNATHVYSTGGIYTVSETASNPHSTNTTTITNYITVYNQTIANITSNVTSGLTPTVIQFYANTSTNATWWNWSFGDGNVSNITVENPVYTYTSGGNYTVNLTTSNDGWGENVKTPYYVQIYDAPITGFDANVTYGLLPLHVGFNVTNADDHATQWNWSFGDGTFGDTQNVTHIYTTGGNYTVSEIATNPYYANVTTKTFYITVFSPTTNTFTANISSGYIPLNVLFTATTVNTTWLNWSWGDGTWSNFTNGSSSAIHIFTLPQNHTVNLTTSDNGFGGCTTTKYINATFYGAAASFTAVPSSGTPPLSVVFTDTSTNVPTAWNWSFGDGTYSDSQHVNHTYAAIGVYTVILNSSNTFGWSNYSRNITVYSGAPVANFTVNTSLGASPLAVRFTNDSSYTNASSVTWYWQFGDGGVSYDSDPVHTYTINGVYHANLTLTDEIGTVLSSDTLIYVTGSLIPIPDFIGVPTIGSSPLNVTFTDLTLGTKTGWNWSFGDGNYSNAQNPTHNYTSNGQYTVTLVVANGTLSNYTTKVGYINVGVGTNVVNADYYGTPVTGNYPLTVQFYDTSVCNPICNSWNWDLDGDGSTDSNAKNPTFTYNYPLTYSPKLIASNGVNSGTRIHVGYIVVGPTYMPTTIPQPTGSWVPGYQDNDTGLSVSFRGDATTDLNNGTYLKYWLQNFTTTGNFNVYGFVTSVMAPLMHVFGFWIFLIIWGLYIFAVWIRAQDVTLPLIIGIISMGTFGLLFPKEALPVIIIMFVICGAIIVTKLMKDSI